MGGTDVADTVHRMLSFLIHNDLAVSMNWTGACNKRAACDLLSMEAVQDAVVSQQRYADVSAKYFQYTCAVRFRNARDRSGGGRTKRTMKHHKPEDVDMDAD
ncbi:hypothetical protein AHF37_00136 [Paragonimus kellicotti]|nr:hypothetical protein AHF37_00136 [Paragonimus kellicotti]